MTVLERPRTPWEQGWHDGEAATVSLIGSINLAMAELVRTIRMLIDTDGWGGWGIRSVEHWVTWKAGISPRRAADLTRIARRIEELPACWALFAAGRLTEDAMVRIARRVPSERDAEVASWAPGFTIPQLYRALASCPELPNPDPNKPDPWSYKQRHFEMSTDAEGWGKGRFTLPPDEMARFRAGIDAAREAEHRDRNGIEPGDDLVVGGRVTWADGLVRMADEAADALDPTLARTGHRGEKNKIVLHRDVQPDGSLGPGQLHLGSVVPDVVARFLSCDAEVQVATYQAGRLLGINPTERTVNWRLRRVIERRDQGCAHPLCGARRWLHVHHIEHWEHGGPTIPSNLVCLCQMHHRQVHHGELSIGGDPEAGTLRVLDARGSPIEPPSCGSPRPLRLVEPSPFTSPYGEPLTAWGFGWN